MKTRNDIYFQSCQLMFRGLNDLQQSSMHLHGFIFFSKMCYLSAWFLECVIILEIITIWYQIFVVYLAFNIKLIVIIIDLLQVKNKIKNMISGCSLRIHLIKTMTFSLEKTSF